MLFLDYELFALMLTGRTLGSHRNRFFSPKLTPQDVKAAIETFKRMDEVIEILQALPTSMILIFRYVCGIIHCGLKHMYCI